MGKTITLKGDACRAFMNVASGSKDTDPYETCATLVFLELKENRKGAMKRATIAIRKLVESESNDWRAVAEEWRARALLSADYVKSFVDATAALIEIVPPDGSAAACAVSRLAGLCQEAITGMTPERKQRLTELMSDPKNAVDCLASSADPTAPSL